MVAVSDLRNDAARVLKRLSKGDSPAVITRRGRAAAVLVSVEAYERAEHEREILRLLARGEQEIARGDGYDLDDVLAEADEILKSK